MEVFTDTDPSPAFRRHPLFKSGPAHRIEQRERFQPYAYAKWFDSRHSAMRFCVESQPRKPWMAAYRVTLIANDETGLLPAEVFAIFELLLGKVVLSKVEVAFDFSRGGVDRSRVRLYGLFGRSRSRRRTVTTDYWGSRRSGRLTKSYWKPETDSHPVELELRCRFLKRHGIRGPLEFPRLMGLIPKQNVWFAKIDKAKLSDFLRARGKGKKQSASVSNWVNGDLGCNVDAALRYLREEVRLNNPRRLLRGLPENRLVENALGNWCNLGWDKRGLGRN